MRRNPAVKAPLALPRRGDALKTVLIVIAILGGLTVLSCLGVGVGGYFWFKKNFANLAVTDPVKIRELTTELTDISIPVEFVPQTASQFLGMHTVLYQWCPSGTCPVDGDGDEAEYNAGQLTLTMFQADEPGEADADPDEFWEESFTETNLQERFRNFTKATQELTIRGKACKFFIVKGEEIPWDVVSDNPDMADAAATPAESPTTTDIPSATESPATTEPASPAEAATPPPAVTPVAPAKPGRQIVWVEGVFPGKKGECTLNLYLLGSDYNEAKILAMLQSIQ